MTSQFLPSTLPLLPLPPPQVLFPYLRVTLTLSSQQLAVVLNSIAENARNQKIDDGARLLAVVPVVEIERRVGRWATAARVVKIDNSKDEDGKFRFVLEGLVGAIWVGCGLMKGQDQVTSVSTSCIINPAADSSPNIDVLTTAL
jgi:hypothetical protein